MIQVGPVGSVVRGDVLDCNKQHLEAALRHYDPQLYIRWNPSKRQGHGMWEIRRRPQTKTAVYAAEYDGATIFKLEYVENDLTHHVTDVAALNYKVLTWLKENDTWEQHNWLDELEYKRLKHKEVGHQKALADRTYNLKQERSAINDFRQYILSGGNPHRLAQHWGKKSGQ